MKLKESLCSFIKLITYISLLQICMSLENKLKNKQNDIIVPLVSSNSNYQSYTPMISVNN